MADTRIYKHPKRPEWGMAMVAEWVDDRVRFVFEDAQVRAFKADSLSVLEICDVGEPEATALRTKLERKIPKAPKSSSSHRAKLTAARKAARPTPP